VVPLIKKRGLSIHDPANYRPITNLHTFFKILEKLFLARLQPHIKESGNYCKFQSAYRKGCSTETALVRVVNDIRRAAGDGQCTVLLALDISAAFDAVDHTTLVERAKTVFGINGATLDWLRSFVTERSQFIAVGTERSETVACLSGVPQGSVLGPILFGMYVSPVGDLIAQHNISYHQYADDLQLYMSLNSEDFNDLSAMEICAVDVSRWFVENALLLNSDKTEAVVFGTRKRLPQLHLSSGIDVPGTRIDFTESIKLLGVVLDASLTFEKHVLDIVRGCHFHIRALRHIRPLLTLDAAKTFAVAIVSSRLE